MQELNQPRIIYMTTDGCPEVVLKGFQLKEGQVVSETEVVTASSSLFIALALFEFMPRLWHSDASYLA
jgi:hypothetical protein